MSNWTRSACAAGSALQLCTIAPGRRGLCGVRENQAGRLISLVYGLPAAVHVDPIEKKPLFHFLPGSTAYSVGTVGCNLGCPFCQNHELSLAWKRRPSLIGQPTSPDELVAAAEGSHCRSLCFTYSEPTIFFEYMLDAARLARERGLRTVMVSNGFIEEAPLQELIPWLDAANIDLKAFRDRTYRELLGGALEPVLRTIRLLAGRGVWVEVTTLVVPGMNDSAEELREIAAFLAGVDPGLPWHLSRFFPSHQWTHLDPTPAETLHLACELGRQAGLRHVYLGNVPGDREDTLCPSCGRTVIERRGYRIWSEGLKAGGRCGWCGQAIRGVFEPGA